MIFQKIYRNFKITTINKTNPFSLNYCKRFIIKFSKRNMDHFKNGGDFTDLIDYGKSVIEN